MGRAEERRPSGKSLSKRKKFEKQNNFFSLFFILFNICKHRKAIKWWSWKKMFQKGSQILESGLALGQHLSSLGWNLSHFYILPWKGPDYELFIFKDGKQKNQEPLTHRSVVVPCKAEYEEKIKWDFRLSFHAPPFMIYLLSMKVKI